MQNPKMPAGVSEKHVLEHLEKVRLELWLSGQGVASMNAEFAPQSHINQAWEYDL